MRLRGCIPGHPKVAEQCTFLFFPLRTEIHPWILLQRFLNMFWQNFPWRLSPEVNKTLADIAAGQQGDFGRDFQGNLKKNWTEAFASLEDEDPTFTFTEAEYLRETSQVMLWWHVCGHHRIYISGLEIPSARGCHFVVRLYTWRACFSPFLPRTARCLVVFSRYQRLFRCFKKVRCITVGIVLLDSLL